MKSLGIRCLWLILTLISGSISSIADEPTLVTITRVSTQREYLLGTVAQDGEVYSDRNYRLHTFPPGLEGRILIRTSNEDDQVRADDHLRIQLSKQATIYVFWDRRAYRPAEWLRGWQRVKGQAKTGDTEFQIYRKTFAAGLVKLGGNNRSQTGAASNYFLAVDAGKGSNGLENAGVVDDKMLSLRRPETGRNDNDGGNGTPVSTRAPIVPDGFAVKLFAHEPMVHNPCAMCFDAKGRLTVSHGPQYRSPKPDTPGDQVLFLIDENDDGVADRSHVFAEGFNSVQGLAWNGDQLWVANAPDLTMVRDTDGDDVADEYVRVYTDLGNLEHGLHGLNWAPDGKLYMSKGNSKGHNRPAEDGRVAPRPFRELFGLADPENAPDFQEPVRFSRTDYYQNGKGYHDPSDDWGRHGGVLRCDAMGQNLEIVSRGFRNPWDIAFDGGFHWLGTDNDQDQGDKIFAPFFGAHFGWGHPWSYDWLGQGHAPTVPASAPLFEGSGTGIVYYSASQFPDHYGNAYFINDWLRQRTYIYRPAWNGALRQPRDQQNALEDFAIEDIHGLYKPTDIEVGPDGTLYVNCWGVEYGAKWKQDGENRTQINEGRIYRIWYLDRPLLKRSEWYQAKRDQPLSAWTIDQLLEDLGQDALPIWRVNAQNELVRRGSAVRATLISKLRTGKLPEMVETWIAWTAGRLEEASVDDFFSALIDHDTTQSKHMASLNLRIQALRILAHRSKSNATKSLPKNIAAALRDQQPRIRFEAVQAIWQAQDRSQLEGLLKLADVETDRVTSYSVWNAIRDLATLDERKEMLDDRRPGVRFAALMGLMDDFELSKQEVLKRIEHESDARYQQWGLKWVLAGSPPRTVSNQKERVASKDELRLEMVLDQLASTDNGQIRAGLLKLLLGKRIQGNSWDRVRALFDQRRAKRSNTDHLEIAAMLRVLAFDPRSVPILWGQVLHPHNAVRTAAIDGLAENDDARDFLLRKLAEAKLVNRQQSAIIMALSRQLDKNQVWPLNEFTVGGLESVYSRSQESRTKSKVMAQLIAADPKDLSAALRTRLLKMSQSAANHRDPRVYNLASTLANRLGGSVSMPVRKPVTTEDIVPLLADASPARGEEIFFDRQRANCATCHRVGGRGTNFAPSLSDIGGRSKPEEILESVLHPSRKITEGFAVTNVITDRGRTLSGVVKFETSAKLQLFQNDGRLIDVAKDEIEERVLSKLSIMPSTFGLLLTKQELADIVAWLMTMKQPDRSIQTTLAKLPETKLKGSIELSKKPASVVVTANGQPLATYFFADEKITRPYFAHVHAPGGIQVTRNHPPQAGDPGDHADYHPGIFLAFGDISGHDYWRLRAKVVHAGFVEEPRTDSNRGSFSVRNRYMSTDGETIICEEVCRYKFSTRANFYTIDWDSTFNSNDADFYFGDQEEMGLGVRVASAIRESGGNGRISNSNGLTSADKTWGQPAAWCDYSGTIVENVGVTILASPKNVRTSWWHNRGYGLSVANLFGRTAMRQGEKSKIVVRKGEPFRLRYRILLHRDSKETSTNMRKEYDDYTKSQRSVE